MARIALPYASCTVKDSHEPLLQYWEAVVTACKNAGFVSLKCHPGCRERGYNINKFANRRRLHVPASLDTSCVCICSIDEVMGRGVRATRGISVGTVVGQYGGSILEMGREEKGVRVEWDDREGNNILTFGCTPSGLGSEDEVTFFVVVDGKNPDGSPSEPALINDCVGTGRPPNVEYCIDGRICVIRTISARDQLLADYGVEYDRVWVKLGTRIEARWKGKWYSGTIAGSMEMKQRQNRLPKKKVLCFEIAWTDPEDFGKKNWVDRDDVRTVA